MSYYNQGQLEGPYILTPSRPSTPIPQVYVSHESLRHSLRINPNLAQEALNKAVHRNSDSSASASHLIQQLRRADRFKSWLQSNRSGFLYLGRNAENSQIFSSLAAMLVQSLESVRPAMAVHFFCPILDDENPSGSYHLLRTLIFQLLRFPNNLTVTPQELSQPHGDPRQLKYLFNKLLWSMQGTIFVIIDGILRHWTDDEEESMFVAQLLYETSQTQFPNLIVKVLFTSPVPFEIRDHLPEDSKLMLAAEGGEFYDFGQSHLTRMISAEPLNDPDSVEPVRERYSTMNVQDSYAPRSPGYGYSSGGATFDRE